METSAFLPQPPQQPGLESYTAIKDAVQKSMNYDRELNTRLQNLFSRLAGEINAANAAIVASETLSVKDYGALGDGIHDDTAAIQAAFNAAGFGARVYFPNGVYLVSSQLVIPQDVIVQGESTHGVIILQAASAIAINGVFAAYGATSLPQTINGVVAKGDRTITLTNAAGYAIGDLIEVRNIENAVQVADGSHNEFTLITRIMDIVGNVLSLLDPLPFAIAALDNETVLKVDPRRVEIHNLTLNGLNNTGQAPNGNNAIVLFYTQNVQLQDVNIVNYPNGYGTFMWGSYDSRVDRFYSQNSGDQVGFGAAFGSFDCTRCTFDNITAIWPGRDGIVHSRNSLCQYTNQISIRAKVRNVKFHGCRECTAVNIIGNNSQGGTGLTISGGTSDSAFANITTTGNKGPNAVGNQVGVWFADLNDDNNVLSNVNSWDNGDWDLAVFSTDNGNVVQGGHFSSPSKILNQNGTPVFNVSFDDLLPGVTSVAMVDNRTAGVVGPSHVLKRHWPSAPGVGVLMGEYVFAANSSVASYHEYAKMYGINESYTGGAETASINFSTFRSGVDTLEARIGGGMILGNPTGGAQGIGTLNAVGVYDDGAGPLTDYVFDKSIEAPERFDRKFLDPAVYAAFWKEHGHLSSMPSREEWQKERKSLGDLVQRLWEATEIQAVLIEDLRQKLERK